MSILLFLGILALFIAGYFFYGNFLSGFFGVDEKRVTPANAKYDGSDFVPARNWLILFGHHFASIAGAGPIIGPVLAYLWWGWLGAVIWLVLGSIFMGALHDFASLFISLREEGRSIGQIAEKYISRRTGFLFLIFLFFTLILIIAVFAAICADTFINEPQVVLSSTGLIPVAILVGFLIYRLRMNLAGATLVGIFFMVALIFLGARFPLSLGVSDPYTLWVVLLFVYAFFASIIPVNILLKPRDYISSFLLFFGIAVSFFGIISRPFPLEGAKLVSFNAEAGPLFPVMFITLACGAISGFHSLVASGTTSKQLANEKDAKKIGYGAMILEGVLATIVLFCVAFALGAIPEGKTETEIFSLGFSKVCYFMGDYAKFVALVILNSFILTTLDTATRIARFIMQELFQLKNKWLATAIIVTIAAYLALAKKWQIIWPLFGAANQLVAGLTLIVVSGWLFCKGKKYYIAFIPALIMIFITLSALILKLINFYQKENFLLCAIAAVLIVLGSFALFEFRRVVKCRVK
ncbi:MAG: carbon starvation protein A [Candidatus Omnitrophica bacterium]|nr:carbon starvation protein A [Candidatus Omnitrophota bacterium]MBD3268907.1 carbon starvation protein A [Candidatus Omnitrophota bacterium]